MSGRLNVTGIVFTAPGVVEVWRNLQLPQLGPTDVEIITTMSGVSPGTEKNRLLGGNYSLGFPSVAGYQQVGQVGRVGSAVIGLKPGQRVYAHDWGHPFVGQTARPGAHVSTRIGPADDIAFGAGRVEEANEFDSLGRVGRRRNLTALPDDLPDQEAAFLSLASIGLHAAGRGGADLGVRTLVLGLGLIGIFAGQGALVRGSAVVGVDRVPLRLAKAKEVGFEAVLDVSQTGYWEGLARAGPFDLVIETTGNNELIDEIMRRRLIARGGRFVIVGGRWQVSYDFNSAHLLEVSMVHSEHHTQTELEEVIRLRRAGRWQIAPLITHVVLPGEAPQVWDMILHKEDWLGVVFDWQAEQ